MHKIFFITALLLLYDVTNKTSFDNIRAWLVEIHEYAQDDVVILLLGKFAVTKNLSKNVDNYIGVFPVQTGPKTKRILKEQHF